MLLKAPVISFHQVAGSQNSIPAICSQRGSLGLSVQAGEVEESGPGEVAQEPVVQP